MSMTDAEKAEMDQLKADNAELQKTVAELKKSKIKADTDAKLAAAGFKLAANGEFEGLSQPPSGGCELKPAAQSAKASHGNQPPSGGCELKRRHPRRPTRYKPAAFGRL